MVKVEVWAEKGRLHRTYIRMPNGTLEPTFDTRPNPPGRTELPPLPNGRFSRPDVSA